MATRLYCHEAMAGHDPGPHHPESVDRYVAIERAIEGLDIPRIRPEPAPREALLRVHTDAHVRGIEALAGRRHRIDADTRVGTLSIPAALLAAGAGVQAVDDVMTGAATRAFALVRPPGHHAESNRAMGFCVFNNLAIAVQHARAVHGCRRVLVIDWDVHHGNGTQEAFWETPEVVVFDIHRYPFFPGSGAAEDRGTGSGLGYTINVPLPAELGDGDYAEVMRTLLLPIADRLRPELVVVSAGFDAHLNDPLGDMCVSAEGFATLCAFARGVADAHAGGKLLLLLEGGYAMDALTDSIRSCSQVLLGAEPPPRQAPKPATEGILSQLRRLHHPVWTT